ncbi:MAG: glutamine synthetase, partial [Candidatus Diapherotrites archaeon]|nr:glutamine synthetase [Candidatus Diapherotrites archaeon]
GIKTLPYSLREAVEELKNDSVLVETLGEHAFKQYVEAKTAEYDEYRLQVTQWEIERYLEKI